MHSHQEYDDFGGILGISPTIPARAGPLQPRRRLRVSFSGFFAMFWFQVPIEPFPEAILGISPGRLGHITRFSILRPGLRSSYLELSRFPAVQSLLPMGVCPLIPFYWPSATP